AIFRLHIRNVNLPVGARHAVPAKQSTPRRTKTREGVIPLTCAYRHQEFSAARLKIRPRFSTTFCNCPAAVYCSEAKKRPVWKETTMPAEKLTGSEFKKQLRAGQPKMGLFLNSHSPTVAEQLAHSGYDWLLVDTQHGPMGYEKLSAMLSGISNGGAKSLVRVGGYDDRPGIQQALDLGADGVLVPYINTAEEARQAISCTKYPTVGTRSVYFPQRSMNKAGLLGYAGNFNNDGIVALQVETASCIENIAEIAAVPGVDILFLGQNDLCMSMSLYEKYEFPHMYTSPELEAATQKLVDHARKNKLILGIFLFGTARVGE